MNDGPVSISMSADGLDTDVVQVTLEMSTGRSG